MTKRNFTLVGAHAGKTIHLGNYHFVDGVLSFEGPDADVLILTRVLREQYQAFGPDELEAAQAAYEEAQAEAALNEPRETAASLEMDLKQKLVARRMITEGLDPETLYGKGPMAEQVKANMAILLMEEDEGSELVATAEEIAAQKAAAEQADKDRLAKEAADKAEADRLAKEAADKEAADKAEADRLAKEEADKAEKERLDKEAANAAAAGGTENGGTLSPAQENTSPAGEPYPESQENGGGEQAPVAAKIETVADALQALDPANDEQWTARGVPSIDAMSKLLGRDVSRAEIEEVAPDYTRSVAKAAKAKATTAAS